MDIEIATRYALAMTVLLSFALTRGQFSQQFSPEEQATMNENMATA